MDARSREDAVRIGCVQVISITLVVEMLAYGCRV